MQGLIHEALQQHGVCKRCCIRGRVGGGAPGGGGSIELLLNVVAASRGLLLVQAHAPDLLLQPLPLHLRLRHPLQFDLQLQREYGLLKGQPAAGAWWGSNLFR